MNFTPTFASALLFGLTLSACGDAGTGETTNDSDAPLTSSTGTTDTPTIDTTDAATTETTGTTAPATDPAPTVTTDEPATDPATDPTTTTDPGDTDTDGAVGDEDYLAMQACELTSVCPEWHQMFAESEPYGDAPERLCVWEGLRDGTLGRYTYLADYEFGNGHNDTHNILHVHADRKVTFVQHHDGYLEEEGPYDTYTDAMTCTLREPAFFDACPEADLFDLECYWLPHNFTTSITWFTDCTAAGPMCQ